MTEGGGGGGKSRAEETALQRRREEECGGGDRQPAPNSAQVSQPRAPVASPPASRHAMPVKRSDSSLMTQGALGWSSPPAGVASLRFAWWRMYDAAGVDHSFGRGANAVVALQLLLAVEVSRHPPVCAFQVDADLTPSLSSPNGRVFSVDLSRK